MRKYGLLKICLMVLLLVINSYSYEIKLSKKRIQRITYEIVVNSNDAILHYGTAVSLSNHGKMVALNKDISSYSDIKAIDLNGVKHDVKVGEVFQNGNLVYLYIKGKCIPYAKTAKSVKEDEKIALLGSDKTLIHGSVSQIKESGAVLDFGSEKPASGDAVFNHKNELVGMKLENSDSIVFVKETDLMQEMLNQESSVKAFKKINIYE
jgi:hypothetical protein